MRVRLEIEGEAHEPAMLEVLAALRRAAPAAPIVGAPAAAEKVEKAAALAAVDTERGTRAKKRAAPAAREEEPAAAEPEEAPAPGVAWAEVIAAAQDAAAQDPQRVIAALSKLGVRRVDALEPHQWGPFVAALQAERG